MIHEAVKFSSHCSDCSHLSQLHQVALSLTAPRRLPAQGRASSCSCTPQSCLTSSKTFSAWLEPPPASPRRMEHLCPGPVVSSASAWQLPSCSLPKKALQWMA